MIFLNGEAKTRQIDTIEKVEGGYRVRFKENPKIYNYRYDKVRWLSRPEWRDPANYKVFWKGVLKYNVTAIWLFHLDNHPCWKIECKGNFVIEDAKGEIKVVGSCLDDTVRDTFAYMKKVAATNALGKDKSSPEVILCKVYDTIDFIDENTAAACYLNPKKYKPASLHHHDLIFPFGCNASQKKAVAKAFEYQISVIQGPPGTGKTQTILNIIANILCQGKTVMVVSNNNPAIQNVQQKLSKYGFDFIMAPLGNKQNKENFIKSQMPIPSACNAWKLPASERRKKQHALHDILLGLDKVYALQNEKAELQQKQQTISLEWRHFCDVNAESESLDNGVVADSNDIISAWLKLQFKADNYEIENMNWWSRLIDSVKWWWIKWKCMHRYHTKSKVDRNNLAPLITELQALYYKNKLRELKDRLESIERELSDYDSDILSEELSENSMTLFKTSLNDHYKNKDRKYFKDIYDMKKSGQEMLEQYPVVLSTTFSAYSCTFNNNIYDYLVMDEASQVSSDTGMLSLACAKNAVIVGDTNQLPNVENEEDCKKLSAIMTDCRQIEDGYDCAKYSFLESVLKVIPNVTTTLLREHYRCHPRIINFCNQKFYGGSLLIMTEDNGEKDVLSAIRTTKGNYAVNRYNQREIDVIKEEVLPAVQDKNSIGIVTPYNNQVNAINQQIDGNLAGTIHKYQGREKNTIIMSAVDNQISTFADDPKKLNVAVSRAKNKFILVVTGNEQDHKGNLTDLLEYIAYNNFTVTDSKLASIFDYLYEQYTEQRLLYLKSHPTVSEYDSENLTYGLLYDIIESYPRYKCLKIICHIPLRQVVKDTSLMSKDELAYATNYNTHLDFLLVNTVSKKPILAIETDGYTFHNDTTEQHNRDMMKNHILKCYGLALLRLSTKGHDEQNKIITLLDKCMDVKE